MLYLLTFGGNTDEQISSKLTGWCGRHPTRAPLVVVTLKPGYSATTVRFMGAESVLTDGPYTPEAESLGGLCIIEVADLDEALELAQSWSGGGFVEIRPIRLPGSSAQATLTGGVSLLEGESPA